MFDMLLIKGLVQHLFVANLVLLCIFFYLYKLFGRFVVIPDLDKAHYEGVIEGCLWMLPVTIAAIMFWG